MYISGKSVGYMIQLLLKYRRRTLGWVSTRPHYCQFFRGLNKTKRLVWCREQLRVNEHFGNIIFSDECTIQVELQSKHRTVSTMVRLSLPARQNSISMLNAGYKVGTIQKRLEEENVFTTTRSLYHLVKKFKDTGVYTDLPRQERDKKLSPEMLAIIDNTLKENDKATASELRKILVKKYPDLEVSISTIKYHCRTLALGPTIVSSLEG